MARNIEPTKKVRRRRKPMSEEQRKAASERLAKAREKRAKTNPPKYKNVHPDVLALPDDDPLSRVKVMGWIKENREHHSSAKSDERRNVKGAIAKVANLQSYINIMESYLRSGTWSGMFYGSDQQNKMNMRCLVPAYDEDGNIKRSHGVYYDDLGYVWGREPDEKT